MSKYLLCFSAVLFFCTCKTSKPIADSKPTSALEIDIRPDFTIAFGSCNKHDEPNLLWDEITDVKPDVWIWGGDNIYGDTEDMEKLRNMYKAQNSVAGYLKLKTTTEIIGTWDDHDYGLNDGGADFAAKRESQQEFLDFMSVPADSPKRNQEGIYATHEYDLPEGNIKIFVLDTRYFRTALTKDPESKKPFKPNAYGEGTILGEVQWKWLERELKNSKADFNILVSSIQVLSHEHGFETWGNFPHEVEKLKKLITKSNAKGVLILSGDRHISEFSRVKVEAMNNPLIDFTSSGLTHAYRDYTGEPNKYRVGDVVFRESFGRIDFDFRQKAILMQILGNDGDILGSLLQTY